MTDLETIVNLSKRRGFVFQSSEIYGGAGGCWDYGPLGVELKRNIKNLWWRDNVLWRDDMVGLDASILMHPKVWEASGHVANFSDPMVDCKKCRKRFRADQIVGEHLASLSKCPKCKSKDLEKGDGTGRCRGCGADLLSLINTRFCPDPSCQGGELTDPRKFNLMFQTHMGAMEDSASLTYLRPETAQGIFANFDNVLQTARKKLPFGIGQVGKSFRNEITPRYFTFRTREFEQMEIEFFVKPGTDEGWYVRWRDERFAWYSKYGIRKENLRLREHAKDELAHYAKACSDVEYKFPWGWGELEGIANRTDYDLKQHAKFSGKNLAYFDEESKSHLVPFVIEPSAGADRSTLAFLLDAYHEEEVKGEKRAVLRFHPAIAPVKAAVFPLLKKRDDLVALAKEITKKLRRRWNVAYDDTGAIGKLYRRQDEVGTPFCVTVDVDTVETDRQVTVRDRDTMAQVRVPVDGIEAHLAAKLEA